MKKVLFVAVGLMAAFLLLGFYESSKPGANERMRKRDAIAMCWQEYERKSLGAGEKQFVAGACERMEATFRETYKQNP